MRNIEVEVKAQINDRDSVENKVVANGAIFKAEKYQYDLLLDPPTTNFAQSDQVLRIRNSNGIWKLDYKTPRLDQETKSRKEFSVKIEDGNLLKEILVWMNFTIVGEIEKRRKTYQLADLSIHFDEVTHLGSFIEIEAFADEHEFELSKKKIFSFLKELGISETIKKDYLELLWEKGFFTKGK